MLITRPVRLRHITLDHTCNYVVIHIGILIPLKNKLNIYNNHGRLEHKVRT